MPTLPSRTALPATATDDQDASNPLAKLAAQQPQQGLHGELPAGITMTRNAAGKPVYAQNPNSLTALLTRPAPSADTAPLSTATSNPLTAGLGAGGGGLARSLMDIYRSEASIRGLDSETFDRPGGNPLVAGLRDSRPDEARAFDNFLARSSLQSALDSAAKQGGRSSGQNIAAIAAAMNQTAGQIPGQELARDQIAQAGDIKRQEIAQKADGVNQRSILDGIRTALDSRRVDQADQRIGLQAQRVDIAADSAATAGNPTLSQQRGNAEIDAARQRISGMNPEEIKKRTQQYSATGRENPDFDHSLAKAVTLGNRRKVGADDFFDQRQQGQPQGDDLATRFQADKGMGGHRLGKRTELGTEVYDANGKLIGHYN